MRASYSTSITMSEEDLNLFNKIRGEHKIIDIFRAGLISCSGGINTVSKELKRSCGCVYDGNKLCKEHGRV